MPYTPLTLTLDSIADGKFRATLRHPKEGKSKPVEFLWSEKDIFNGERVYLTALKDINDFKSTTEKNPYVELLGDALYNLIFQGDMKVKFEHWSSSGDVVAIRINAAPAIARLPWELLRDPSGYLGQRLSILRYDENVGDCEIKFHRPFTALIVSASPSLPGYTFDDAAYLESVKEHLAGMQANVVELRNATRKTLEETLTAVRPQIFHFVGHGVMESTGGSIVLNDPESKKSNVEGGLLAQWLIQSGVQLAFLCSCETGKDFEGFRGVAGALIARRVPAVVAMQFNLPQQDARIFVERFYANLGKSMSVENALYKARGSFDPKRLVWFIPALHSQVAGEVALQDSSELPGADDIEENPFLDFGTHSRPDRFSGQHDILNDLLDSLLQQRNVLVAGERRTGKTSLLRYLADPGKCRQFGLDPKNHLHVFFDVSCIQSAGLNTEKCEADFWRFTLRLLERRILEEYPAQANAGKSATTLKALQQADTQAGDRRAVWRALQTAAEEFEVAFFLDEFDHLIHLGLRKEFFDWLAALNEQLQIKFIVAPKFRPEHYIELGLGSSHHFFENCRKFDLGPLDARDFREFLERHFDTAVPTRYKELSAAIQFVTGGTPYYMQIACAELFAVKPVTPESKKAWIERFWAQARESLADHWESSTPDEQVVMAILALRGQGPGVGPKISREALQDYCPRSSALDSLRQRGLAVEQAGRMALASPSLEAWILLHLTLAKPGKEGERGFEEWYADRYTQDMSRAFANVGRATRLLNRLNPELWGWFNTWCRRLRYQDSGLSLLSLAPANFEPVAYLMARCADVRNAERS